VFVVLPARWRGTETPTAAFAIGYLLHLVGDVLPASLSRRTLDLSPVLWPISDRLSIDAGGTFAKSTATLLVGYVTRLLTPDLTLIVALQLGSVLVGTALWVSDGCPGVSVLRSPVRRLRET
jgi:hypothetical protein